MAKTLIAFLTETCICVISATLVLNPTSNPLSAQTFDLSSATISEKFTCRTIHDHSGITGDK